MTTRIFLFHPDIHSGSTVNRALAKKAQEKGIEVRDEYSLYPDFRIDAKAEQEILEDTDRIVLQFPMYWYSTPALLKEWLDKVLVHGWAYGSTGKALVGKEMALAFTQGAKAEDYTREGRFHATNEELLKPLETAAYYVGLKFLPLFVVSGTLNISQEELDKAAQRYVDYLVKES